MRGFWMAALLAAATAVAGCPREDDSIPPEILSSRAYKGHETDTDMNNLVQTYPAILGTRLDDCQTCHTGGTVTYPTKSSTLNPCSYCHLVYYPDATIVSGAPTTYQDTLNPYGLAYKTYGRSKTALTNIEALDSDTDTYSNITEINALRYPGDATSMPGQPTAPIITLTWTQITGMTSHEQFLLMNAHKQEFDDYANYVGVKVADLLTAAGVNMTGATGVTIIAPDGFMKDFTLAEMQQQFADGIYDDGLAPADFADPAQGFVVYPPDPQIPAGLADMGTIPDDMFMIIAYMRDGGDIDPCTLDPVTGKINGEGPYRHVVPQTTPGTPDRGSTYSPTTWGDGYDYDSLKDHNAGNCVRGVVAIRVNPMPVGFEEFDWKNGGYSLLEEKKIIIYGNGVN